MKKKVTNRRDLQGLITRMIHSRIFEGSQFNRDISSWNVRNVKIMYDAFFNSQFNGDLYDWNIENLENFNYIFDNCPMSNSIYGWLEKRPDLEELFKRCFPKELLIRIPIRKYIDYDYSKG